MICFGCVAIFASTNLLWPVETPDDPADDPDQANPRVGHSPSGKVEHDHGNKSNPVNKKDLR